MFKREKLLGTHDDFWKVEFYMLGKFQVIIILTSLKSVHSFSELFNNNL